MNQAAQTKPLIYRKKVILESFGIGETTLRRWMRECGFPRPRQMGPRAVGWRADQVHAWLETRPEATAST